ncbi:hypothetical protein PR202_gb26702 [Eleusine coracana subsp. coracana]|uniref:RNA exonuclease 4 n=1 Tax=Eleusine coracana subsp. coracana TaxID=191504 RepID=A0AAV5FRU1_ELECO|nr:hypothetical protein QOZ80_1BG0055320 [Eleusine coracana subsp. coracana]GJN37721.1 hypothetical protein PR202_gb26702 [Eleusine coracana subsp. coracana]
MDSSSEAHGRHKCAACFRQFNRMEHLVEHMRTARHSSHDPRCLVCLKHCRSFEALRDHLGAGGSSLPKAAHCATVFAARGCSLCLGVFPSAARHSEHYHAECKQSRTPTISISMSRLHITSSSHRGGGGGGGALALGCKMVGAGSDGSLDVCARVCLVDERENVVYETFVKPPIPVTQYRYERTGIRPEHLRGGAGVVATVKQAQERVQELLRVRTSGGRGRAMLLVGHGLDHDLAALGFDYPAHLKRDTAQYPPLMKTSKLSNSLKFLTYTYLGYEIQTGHQHPYEDCVAAMRLYQRMRAQRHRRGEGDAAADGAFHQAPSADSNAFPAWRQRELERMTPEELLQLSTPDYYCWCLDG